ncbi:hypothetical protein EVAR_53109_1 [Eumeta japonica]|uniref:Uncharacterized protein n=1 Tax=Eumeta variegata TaxID=151549 RepID=A0A4C1Y6U5_EUMVA|nr:hypothetical protein EVAR_53109_1 [Eumeta japonica]
MVKNKSVSRAVLNYDIKGLSLHPFPSSSKWRVSVPVTAPDLLGPHRRVRRLDTFVCAVSYTFVWFHAASAAASWRGDGQPSPAVSPVWKENEIINVLFILHTLSTANPTSRLDPVLCFDPAPFTTSTIVSILVRNISSMHETFQIEWEDARAQRTAHGHDSTKTRAALEILIATIKRVYETHY